MKSLRIAPLALALLVGLSACAGSTARKEVLLPALRLAWVDLSQNVETGIAAAQAAGEITELEATSLRGLKDAVGTSLGDVDAALVSIPIWESQLAPMAIRGIKALVDSGQLAPPLDEILRLRVESFTKALRKLEAA